MQSYLLNLAKAFYSYPEFSFLYDPQLVEIFNKDLNLNNLDYDDLLQCLKSIEPDFIQLNLKLQKYIDVTINMLKRLQAYFKQLQYDYYKDELKFRYLSCYCLKLISTPVHYTDNVIFNEMNIRKFKDNNNIIIQEAYYFVRNLLKSLTKEDKLFNFFGLINQDIRNDIFEENNFFINEQCDNKSIVDHLDRLLPPDYYIYTYAPPRDGVLAFLSYGNTLFLNTYIIKKNNYYSNVVRVSLIFIHEMCHVKTFKFANEGRCNNYSPKIKNYSDIGYFFEEAINVLFF